MGTTVCVGRPHEVPDQLNQFLKPQLYAQIKLMSILNNIEGTRNRFPKKHPQLEDVNIQPDLRFFLPAAVKFPNQEPL